LRHPGAIRVLILAEACNPSWSSVPLLGYNFAKALSDRPDLDATLVTQVRNRESLEADPISKNVPITYIDNEAISRPLFRLSRFLRGGTSLSWTTAMALSWPAYIAFEKIVYRRFAERFRRREFDIIHRITPVSPTLSSPLSTLVRIPMVIGPLNGGLPWPKEHPDLRAQEREWLVPLRRLYKHLPYYKSTYRHLAAVIAGSRHTASEIPLSFSGRRYYLPENGIDPSRFPIEAEKPAPGPRFRFVTVGRLVPYKGMHLILEAMSRSELLRACDLYIIGDGPRRSHLEGLARDLGLQDRVRFLGWLEQREVARELASSQAFVFPSLREFGGGVVLEAMASGLPSIVVDYGGPGELVTPECGIAIPMAPREPLVTALTEAMETMAADPECCQRLGDVARQRARSEFTWDSKAARLVDFYREILAGKTADDAAASVESRG
jgi:phosphatidylinositol alpha-1,6-mannosyltransferase